VDVAVAERGCFEEAPFESELTDEIGEVWLN